MRSLVSEALTITDRRSAIRRFSDHRNLVVLYFAGTLLILEGITGIAFWRTSGNPAWLWLVLAVVPALVIIRSSWNLRRPVERRRISGRLEHLMIERADRNLRTFVLLSYATVCAVVVVRWSFRWDDEPLVALILLTIAFRISLSERLIFHLSLLLAALAVILFRPGAGFGTADDAVWTPMSIYLGLTMVSLLAGWFLTRGFEKSFESEWVGAQAGLREQERIRGELELARSIQLSMLPREVPRVQGLEVAAVSTPATEVGGDFYDFFFRNGSLRIVEADVAGHGVGSAIVLSGVRSALRLLSADYTDPRDILSRLDSLVRETKTERMLVTLCLVSIAPDQRTASVISAGHPPVLHWSRSSGVAQAILLPSLPLGTGLSQDLAVAEITLEPGDRLLIHSDGAYETRNAAGDEWGLDELSRVFSAGASRDSAGAMLDRLMAAMEQYRDGAQPQDDVTLVSVRIL